MAISRVKIENYRSIRKIDFKPGPLCILVGENNAGKSNILAALRKVLVPDWVTIRYFSEDDRRDKDPDNDIVVEVEFNPPLKHKPFVRADEVDIPVLRFCYTRYKVDTDRAQKGEPRLQAECLTKDGKGISVPKSAPRKGQKLQFERLTNIPNDVRDQVQALFIGTDRSLSSQFPTARYSLLRRLLEDVDQALRAEKGEGGGKTRYEEFVGHLQKAMEALRINELNELEGLLRRLSLQNLGYDPDREEENLRFHFALFDSFEFLKSIRLSFVEHGREFDASELGEGAQNALVIAIFQAYEKLQKSGALFLLEEPEMYLHPQRQRYFFRTLRSIFESNQVFYTTHSPNFVAIPEYEEVHVVHRGEDGYTEIRSSSLRSTAAIQERLRKEFDPERNELFFAKRVILVEGDTEKLAIPEFARKLGRDLDREGFSVVEVGGKRNLLPMADIVKSFGIPLAVVFDRDSGEFKDKREEEMQYNEGLSALGGEGVVVHEHKPDYEGELRVELGEEQYLALCQKYSGVSKPVRQRLIAADDEVPVPGFISAILQ